jgi:hypothetical protein
VRVGVEDPAVRVSVELPDPGAAIEAGLKVAVAPLGSPEADSVIAALNPPETVVVMVLVPEPPWTTLTGPCDAEIVKSVAGAAVTVKVTAVVCVVPPPVPLIITLDVPVGVEAPVVSVSVEVPDPGAATEVGLNVAVVPVGSNEADSAIAALNPLKAVVVMVVVPEFPCTTVTVVGDSVIVKSGVGRVTVKVTAAVWVVLPPMPVIVTV